MILEIQDERLMPLMPHTIPDLAHDMRGYTTKALSPLA